MILVRSTKKIGAMLTIMAFVLSLMAITAFAATNDGVDWDKGIIRATGYATGKNRALAHRAARMDAMRNLAEQVKGVQVDAESTMEDLELKNDLVKTKVSAIIKNMQEVGEPTYDKDGYCSIVMEMPLFGSSDSLAEAAFIPFKDQAKEPFPQPTTTTTTTTTTITSNSAVAAASAYNYTGLIVDCSGLGLKPVMSPVIKNNSGQPIYGYKNLDYDKIIAYGMASYVRSVNDSAASRAGNNPLVVKALSVENHNANPIVKISDSDAILIANQGSHFLDNCAVVFVR